MGGHLNFGAPLGFVALCTIQLLTARVFVQSESFI